MAKKAVGSTYAYHTYGFIIISRQRGTNDTYDVSTACVWNQVKTRTAISLNGNGFGSLTFDRTYKYK